MSIQLDSHQLFFPHSKDLIRCGWVNSDPLYIHYHDTEWGVPCYNQNTLFAMLCLEGQQAGLSWYTVLKKRHDYYTCFHQFIPEKVALMQEDELNRLMQDSRIIRHKLKLQAIVNNAKALLKMQTQGENFGEFIWSFVDGEPLVNHFDNLASVPAQTPQSVAMSKALKKKGFSFVGPTICYAFMQACGLVNDHLLECHVRNNSSD